MYIKTVDNKTILFNIGGWDSIDFFNNACNKSVPIIESLWGVKVPDEYRIFILGSFKDFFEMTFSSRNVVQKAIILLYFPLVYKSLKKQWTTLSGAALQKKPVFGIKTDEQMRLGDPSIGQYIFRKEPNIDKHIESTVCHELFHISVHKLSLPLWLNEGLAIYAQEKFEGKRIVREDTLDYLLRYPIKTPFLNYRNLSKAEVVTIVYDYARGYWLISYFEEKFPGLIQTILDQHLNERKIEELITSRTGMHINLFWNQIDQIMYDYFKKESASILPDS